MGNCRSSASIYFAAHAEHEKLRPVVDALSLRDGEAMHLFMQDLEQALVALMPDASWATTTDAGEF